MIRILSFILLLLCGCSAHNPKQELLEIEGVLAGQAQAWNNGNLNGYMTGYWMSDSLVFTGGKSISYGWQAALDRYKESYPTKERMGTLEFSDFKTRLSSINTAYSTGQWSLDRSDGKVSGRFTLVWKKINGGWFIVADHSS